jgi:hypothetical protein
LLPNTLAGYFQRENATLLADAGNTRTLKVASSAVCTQTLRLFDYSLQRRVVEQLHMVEADAGEAEASLGALLDDRVLDYLRKWLGDKLEEMPANCDYGLAVATASSQLTMALLTCAS